MKQNIIYIRTSTLEQSPKNQLKDCEQLAKRLNINDYEVLEEKQSAYKNIERDIFNSIKKAIQKKEVNFLLCWDLDRLFRNRKKLIEFFEYCKIYNCCIYSFRQEWLESLNQIQEPFNEIMFNLMLQIMGWLAEDESRKKSERVKNAVRKNKKGITISYKGNRWGRKSLTKNTIQEVLDLKDSGMSIREIADSVFYWDKNNNRRGLSKSAVHKILS